MGLSLSTTRPRLLTVLIQFGHLGVSETLLQQRVAANRGCLSIGLRTPYSLSWSLTQSHAYAMD
jgi:hypothetical protein